MKAISLLKPTQKMKLLPLLFGFLPISLTANPIITTGRNISPDTDIKITFETSIVEKQDLDIAKENSLLTITPNWEGQIKWSTQNIATFIPTEAPQLNTEYSFSIADVTDLNNDVISSEETIKKKTPKFSHTLSRKIDSVLRSKRPKTYLLFNDNIEPNKLAGFFFYKNKNGETVAAEVAEAKYSDVNSSYYIRSAWSDQWKSTLNKNSEPPAIKEKIDVDQPIKNAIIVRPAETLPPGKEWNLLALKGISNLNKTAKITWDQKFSVGTKEPFKVTSIGAHHSVDDPKFLRIDFNQPLEKSLTREQFDKIIKVIPTVTNLKYTLNRNYLDITGDFKNTSQYTVKVDPSIPSQNGLFLTKEKTKDVTFKDIPASLAIPSFSTAQLSHGQRKYPVKTINMKSIKVRLKALDMTQAVRTHNGYDQYLQTFEQASKDESFKRPPLPFPLINGQVVYEKLIPLTNELNTSKTVVLDWDEILPKRRENLIFFLDIEGTPKDKVFKLSNGIHHSQTFIQLTDIGLAWKKSENNTLIYSYSCNTGEPLSGVKLISYDNDANTAHSVFTDQNGIAVLPKHEQSTHLAAQISTDSFILSIKKEMPTVGLWRFPVEYDWNRLDGWKREALIFTDRELYKPGERVHIKGIVRERNDNDHRIPLERKASLTIYDDYNRILSEENVLLSDHGSFHHTLELPEENVGSHRIKLSFEIPEEDLPDNNWALRHKLEKNANFYSNFSVQEFRKNAFKIISSLEQSETKLSSLTAKVDANYYQGTAVSEGNVDWYLTANKTGFYPDKFPDFYFGDHLEYDSAYWDHYYGYTDDYEYNSESPYSVNGSAKLSSAGAYSIEHKIPELEIPSPQIVNLITEVTDLREQTITARDSLTIHPSTHYIGIERIDQLIRVGNHHPINIISTNNQGQPSTIDLDATVTIKRITYTPTKVRSSSGKVTVQNEKKESIILTKEVNISPATGVDFDFNPTEAGEYNIIVSSKDPEGNSISSAMHCHVYGSSDYSWSVDAGMKIQLVPEKQQYKPGETARILVKTPIEGTALVTLERHNVIRHFKTELSTSNPIIEVPLNFSDAPNVYVSVMLIRGAKDSPRKFKDPTLRLGYCNLNVENVEDKLNVSIDSPLDSYKPDSYITLTGSVADHNGSSVPNAEITLYAEDNGVLDVIGYQMPRPLKAFNGNIPLYVNSGVSLEGFLQEMAHEDMSLINRSVGNKGYTIGGGDGDGGQQAIENKVRSNFDPCAVWSPTLITDQSGKFSISFKTPESLTSYKVMAVVTAGNDKFGSAESEIVVNKPMMLTPLAPRFANEGDIKTTKVLVTNNSKLDGTWKVLLKTGSLAKCLNSDNPSEHSQTVDLKAGESTSLNFETTFVNTGDARWEWHSEPIRFSDAELTPALRTELSDAMESKFKVLFPRPILKGTQFANIDQKPRSVLNEITPDLLNGRGEIELSLSSNLLFRADGAAEHLLKYPYGCVEQTSSKLIPWFAVTQLKPYMSSFAKVTDNQRKKAIQKGANRLLSMQTSDGGLAYWPGGSRSQRWATSYGGHTLILAKLNGANVPQRAIDRICKYLENNLASLMASEKEWDHQSAARALYTLATEERVKKRDLNYLYDKRAELNNITRSYLALAMHKNDPDSKEAKQLIKVYKEEKRKSHWMRYSNSKQLRLFALCQILPDSPETHEFMEEIISRSTKRNHWGTTWVNAATISAMAEYSNIVSSQASTSFTITVNGKEETHLVSQDQPLKKVSYPLEKTTQLEVSSNNRAYVNTVVYCKPKLKQAHPVSNNGVSITKNYYRILKDGTKEPLENPTVSDLVEVELVVHFTKPLSYIVIDDPLPGTFECVNSDFETQSTHVRSSTKKSWVISNQELRDDRALFFLNYAYEGSTTLSYLARITSAGTVTTPSAKVEAMYDPETYGLTESVLMECSDRK